MSEIFVFNGVPAVVAEVQPKRFPAGIRRKVEEQWGLSLDDTLVTVSREATQADILRAVLANRANGVGSPKPDSPTESEALLRSALQVDDPELKGFLLGLAGLGGNGLSNSGEPGEVPVYQSNPEGKRG